MPGPVFRDGDTVELRTVEEEDVEFLQELVNDPRVRVGLGATEPVTASDERDWVESVGEEGDAHFLICVDGDPVGVLGFQPPNEAWGVTELGYMVVPGEWGNGYATDALRELCGYAFEERRLNKLTANAYETNPASRRVLEKVGFTEEGRLRREAFVEGEHVDVYRYGLLAAEWFDHRE
jgi:RimJ/RimL family protein N-acetyltransferase